MFKIVAVCIVLLALAGCTVDENRICRVTSNTSWSGAFENRTVDGSGNQDVPISESGTACCVVQKQTAGGTLTAQIVHFKKKWITGTEEHGGESATTTAAYGLVSVCAHAEEQ